MCGSCRYRGAVYQTNIFHFIPNLLLFLLCLKVNRERLRCMTRRACLLNAETGYQKLPRLCPSSALRQSVMRESSNGLFSSLKEAWDTESSREGNSLTFSTNTKCLIYKRGKLHFIKKINPKSMLKASREQMDYMFL